MVRLAAAVSVTLLLAATAGVQVQRAQRLVAARPLQLPLPGFGAGAGRRQVLPFRARSAAAAACPPDSLGWSVASEVLGWLMAAPVLFVMLGGTARWLQKHAPELADELPWSPEAAAQLQAQRQLIAAKDRQIAALNDYKAFLYMTLLFVILGGAPSNAASSDEKARGEE